LQLWKDGVLESRNALEFDEIECSCFFFSTERFLIHNSLHPCSLLYFLYFYFGFILGSIRLAINNTQHYYHCYFYNVIK